MIWKALTENKLGISLLVSGLALFLGLAVAQGCSLQDGIEVDVPSRIAESTGVTNKVTLAEAPYVYEDWKAQVERDSRQFVTSIERGDEIYALLSGLTSLAFTNIGETASSTPFGALLASLLTGVGGLFLKRPGTDKAVAKEKEASYNAGLAKRVLAPTEDIVRIEAEKALHALREAAARSITELSEDFRESLD